MSRLTGDTIGTEPTQMPTENLEQKHMDFIVLPRSEETLHHRRKSVLRFALPTTIVFDLALLALDGRLAGLVLTFVIVPLVLELLAA